MSAAWMNFLEEPLLTGTSIHGAKSRYSLPGSLAALVRGEIATFQALRSHQRHVWHAFIVQLAALALEKAKETRLPDDEKIWRRMLRGLTVMWPDGEPWCLTVQDAAKPALLQAPVPGGELPQFRAVDTPDALDVLVTSKNHDLKAARMYRAEPEDWLFALVSLQTQQGIMGAGKYGISRMNGGYGARAVIGFDTPGNAGARFRRDVLTLLSTDEDAANPHGLSREGTALLWLKPWNGSSPIDFRELHPFYIEICRRVRLSVNGGRVFAMDAASSGPRISGADQLKGNTGDPWTPVSADGKAFAVSAEGFSFRKLAGVLNPAKYRLPISLQFADADASGGIDLVAQSICRGQGKTQGYHERRIPIPPQAARLFTRECETFTAILESRANALSELRLALRLGLLVLCQRDPSEAIADKEANRKLVQPALDRFEAAAERDFFDSLWQEAAADADSRAGLHKAWLKAQIACAQSILAEAPQTLPHSSVQRYWARAQSALAFGAVMAKSPALQAMAKTAKAGEAAHAIH